MTPTLTATTILIAAAAIYALACWIRPFGKCRACAGTATRKTLILRRLRSCRWCSGSGKRLRYGRRAYNYLAGVHAGRASAHDGARR